MLRETIVDCIGKTPLVRLRLDERSVCPVYAKLELLNPFGMKDRVAKRIILEAKRRGELAEHAPIIESSSGTMALGVALVGTYLGHEVHIVTDPRIDPLTFIKLKALGCTVHIVEKMTGHGWQSARLEKLRELLQQYPGAFWPRQYDNPENAYAYQELAQELLDELDTVDIVVGSVGSGGSLCGTARELRRQNPALKVVAVDAVGSVIFGQPDKPGRLQGGLGNSIHPANVDVLVIDEVHWLSDAEAFGATVELARQEKIFAGNSSGSVYAVARWLSQTERDGTHIVALLPDRGDRYFTTIYSEEYREQKGLKNLELPAAPRLVPADAVVESWSYMELSKGKKRAEVSSGH